MVLYSVLSAAVRFKIMKKILVIGALLLGLVFLLKVFLFDSNKGPLVVQGIVQDNYDLEMTVDLINADTGDVVKTFKINEENHWVQKANVPVGNYKIEASIDGLSPRSLTKVKGTLMTKEVVVNPEVKGNVDKTPRFVAMEGSKDYLSDFYGMVDFQRTDGSMLKGEISREKMEQHYQESIAMQGLSHAQVQQSGHHSKPNFFLLILLILGGGYGYYIFNRKQS